MTVVAAVADSVAAAADLAVAGVVVERGQPRLQMRGGLRVPVAPSVATVVAGPEIAAAYSVVPAVATIVTGPGAVAVAADSAVAGVVVVAVAAAGAAGVFVVVAVDEAVAVDSAPVSILVPGASQGGRSQFVVSARSVSSACSPSRPPPSPSQPPSPEPPIGAPDHADLGSLRQSRLDTGRGIHRVVCDRLGLGWEGRHAACWGGDLILVLWRWTMSSDSRVDWGNLPPARLNPGLSLCGCCQRIVFASVAVSVIVTVGVSVTATGAVAVVLAATDTVAVGGADAASVAGSEVAVVVVAGPVAVAVVVSEGWRRVEARGVGCVPSLLVLGRYRAMGFGGGGDGWRIWEL